LRGVPEGASHAVVLAGGSVPAHARSRFRASELRELFLEAGAGDDAVGVRRLRHAEWHGFGHALAPFGRVQPGVAQVG